MGLLSYLRGDDLSQKAITGTPGVLETLSARQFTPYISLGSSPNERRNDRVNSAYVSVQNSSYAQIYLYNPSVKRVVDYIARNISGLKVYERVSDEERKHRGDHPAAEALRSPNEWTTGRYFIQELFKAHLVYGNAYALKFRSNNGKLTLALVPPHLVGIIGQSFFAPEAFRIWRQDGSWFDVSPEDVFHWPATTGNDPRRGESCLETLRQILAADAAAQQAVTELCISGLQAAAWIERPIEAPEISADGLQRLQESLANQAKKGRARYPILEEGMSLKTGGVTPEDAELLAARRLTMEFVASQYGMKNVPPEGADERQQFYADVLPPLTDMCASLLDLHILQREYGETDLYFEFNPEKLLDEKLKTLTSASGRPVLTTNEARAMVNKPPIKGGDELVTPGNVIVGDKPSPMVMPIQNPNGPPQDGSHRSGENDKPDAAGTRALPPPPRPNLPEAKAVPLIPRRRRAHERRDRWANEYRSVLDEHFERQRRASKSQSGKKALTDVRWATELGNDLNHVAKRQFDAEGKHVAFRLASTFDPDQGENWLAAKAIGAAEAINRVTQEHADADTIDKAFEQAKNRAPAAAMAYATTIAAFSTKVAAEQADGEPTVIIDGGTCDVCAPFQGSWPLSEVEWPAYHANCECVADVQAAPQKAIQGEVKVINQPQQLPPINVNITMPSLPEGMVNFKAGDVTVEPPPPAEIYVGSPEVNVAPAMVSIEEGAMSAPNVTVQAPPPSPAPEVYIDNPVTVEAAHPAEVKLDKGAIEVNVSSPDVIVEGAQAPNVNVEVKGGKTKRTVTFSDGRTAEVEESDNKTKTIKFSDGREATINESEEDA